MLKRSARPAGKYLLAACFASIMPAASAQNARPQNLENLALGRWEAAPLVSAAQKAAGLAGGEGAQWPRAVAVDSSGRFLLFGSDVGGIFRSLDGGKSWEPCNVGYTPRGTSGVAIDPNNSQRVLSVGANSVAGDYNGLYLSTDGAASWRQVFKANIAGSQDNREQIAFDPTSYDTKSKMTRVVFWSRIRDDKAGWGTPESHPALYKSNDGGASWAEIPNTSDVGGSRLRFDPRGRILYAASPRGLFRSIYGGADWAKVLEGDITGVDTSRSKPGSVWACSKDGVFRSDDAGLTWIKLPGSVGVANGDGPLENVHVSSADARRILVWRSGQNWRWPRFWSHDGGLTFSEAKMDNSQAFLPHNSRQALWQWHPTNPSVAWCTGGDWPTISTDGGATWKYSGTGYNVILVGGAWNFNAQNPDTLFVGSQDYNGALTISGGREWQYFDVSGKGWGGFDYGGYAASPQVLVVGDADGWGSPRTLRISRDGGKTWASTEHKFQGPDISLGDPKNPSIIFASNLRSSDSGATWAPMSSCEGAFTFDSSGALYGRAKIEGNDKDHSLAKSTDGGATWQVLANVPGGIDDIAVDAGRDRVYIVSEGALKYLQGGKIESFGNLPKDQWGGVRVKSVALDPVDSARIYVATNRDIFASSASALMSTDAGQSWHNLTRQEPLKNGEKDGGREAIWVRVHPKTRAAWFSTSCYGMWKWTPALREF